MIVKNIFIPSKIFIQYIFGQVLSSLSMGGVTVANVLGYRIIVKEFELPSRYFVHFRIYNLEKDIKPSYPTS